jgi:hypothetical protein
VAFPEPPEPALTRPRRVRARWGAGRIIAVVLAGVLVLGAGTLGGWMLLNPQRVTDQVTVWQFEPDATITGYADRAGLTDEGRFLFYASRPTVYSGDAFDEQCSTESEGVGILGCYQHDDRRIYLFDVTDDRLDGIEEVVAAHEMLHAAWDRMSTAERDALAPLLETEATARAGDPEFAERLAFYAAAEPGQRVNELHSIIGTEFAGIGPELEQHYERYFTSRAELVALHEKSNAVFQQQQEAIDAIVVQLGEIEAGVDADYASYNAGYDELNNDILIFNDKAENGEFASQAAFQRERDALLARQAELDALYDSIAARQEQYTALVAQLDELNAVVAGLNESLNIPPREESGL